MDIQPTHPVSLLTYPIVKETPSILASKRTIAMYSHLLPVKKRHCDISKIIEEKDRKIVFKGRRSGLKKKAHELSILCNCDTFFILFSKVKTNSDFSKKTIDHYSSTDIKSLIKRYEDEIRVNPNLETYNNSDLKKFNTLKIGCIPKKKSKSKL